MFNVSDKLPDHADDIVGAKLLRIQNLDRWTSEKHRLVLELNQLLPRFGYVTFWAHVHRYHLHRVGQSCRYHVPPTRRGKLEPFRGKTVRIACVRSGKYQVKLMAGLVGSSVSAENGCPKPRSAAARRR